MAIVVVDLAYHFRTVRLVPSLAALLWAYGVRPDESRSSSLRLSMQKLSKLTILQ